MKLYIFVEGKETEMSFYPALIKYFHAEYERAFSLSEMTDNSFFILSGLGMPRTFQKIPKCLKDIEEYNTGSNSKIEVFAVVFDRDKYSSVKAAAQAVHDRFNLPENKKLIEKCGIKHFYVLQNPCIETWFLGNKTIIPQSFDSPELEDLIHKYDVRVLDPEKLSLDDMGEAEAARHYLDVIFKARGDLLGYHKKVSMKTIARNDYIHEINNRFKDGHISSFKYAVDLMNIL